MASIKDLQDQMNKNSAAWHGASQAEKDRLHQENQKLQQQIDSMSGGSSSFNSSTGKWTTTGGSSGGGSTGSSNNGGGSSKPSGGTSYPSGNWSSGSNGYGGSYGTDANGQTDYSVLIRDAMNGGADWQTVQDLLNKRVDKAQQSGYGQYMYDDLYKQATEYINSSKNGLYQDYMDKVGSYYDDIQAQQQAAQQAAVDQAVNQLTGQKTGIEQSYDNLYRQLYLDRRRAEKNLPQQMAAMGITGGMAEGTALGIQTSYTDALRQGEQQKLSTLNDIDQAIADARLTGDIGIAQQAAQLAMDKLATYGSLISQMQDQQNWANQFAWQKDQQNVANSQWQQQFNRQQMLDQLDRDDVSYDRKLYIAQYLYENTGDASGFRALGFTDAQIAAMQNSYAMAMQQAMSGSSGGSKGSGGNLGNSSNPGGADYNGLFAAAQASGYPRSFIANHYKEYGFSSQTGLADEYDQWLLSQQTGGDDNSKISESNGSDGNWFTNLMDSIYNTTSPGLNQLQSELNRIEDTSNPSAVRGKAAKIIQQYYERGSITEETAKKLLSQYGIPT